MSIQANDFLNNSLSGTAVVTDQKINISLPSVKVPLEGDKTFVVKIRQNSIAGEVLAESPTITLKDYSEILSITANKQIMEEGEVVQFIITTANIENFSNVYYTTTGNVNFNDFVGGNTGVITIIDNVGYANITANLDLTSSVEGEEQFSLQFRGDSISGPVSATSSNVVLIKDTSNAVSITGLTISSNVIYETESVTFNINTVNAAGANSKVVYYTVTGNADIYSGQSGSFMISNNQANLQLIAEASVPDEETREFAVQFRRNSIAGPILETTGSIIVNSVTANTLISVSAIGGDEVIEIDI